MGASRTLSRKLDLIARIEASGRPEKAKLPVRKRKPRNAQSYRGARHNATRPTGAVMVRLGGEEGVIIDGSYGGSIELNRSQNWSRCKSYAYAREIGPSSEMLR